MSTLPESVRLNLEYYKKQAKTLLQAARAGEAAALARLSRHSKKSGAAPPALHAAQLAIAREQGFASWPKFHAFIEQLALDFQRLTSAFIDAATANLKRANEMLAANPKLAGAGFYAALVLGLRKRSSRHCGRIPHLLGAIAVRTIASR